MKKAPPESLGRGFKSLIEMASLRQFLGLWIISPKVSKPQGFLRWSMILEGSSS